MPFIYPSPNTFQLSNKWAPNNFYSQWVHGPDGLREYLDTTPNHPPYVIGSTTIYTTANNFVDSANLLPRHSMISKLASAFPKPSNPADGYKKLSSYKGGDYDETNNGISNITVKKVIDGQTGNYKIGANTYMGNNPNEDLDNLGYSNIVEGIHNDSNLTKENAQKRAEAVLTLGAASGFTSSPRLIQLGTTAAPAHAGEEWFYSTTPFENLRKIPFAPYQDFRARRGWNNEDLIGKRLDGAALLARSALLFKGKGSVTAGAYAGASATIGAYSVINLEATYGWGEHGTKYALRNDFTARSHVSTRWNSLKGQWVPPGIGDPISKVTAFRGDKVSVIDFKRVTESEAYRWLPKKSDYNFEADGSAVGAVASKLSSLGAGRITQDFIKFYFTGPKIVPWDDSTKDDVMVFRAILTNLTDSYNPQWTPVQYIGRADPNYNYTSYSRDINLDFTVYATDKDELKPIWRKLNALATYTAPEYDNSTIALKGSYLRLTLGDLFRQQPIIITSLYYTLVDPETTWEINVEEDPGNMQVPMKIQVSVGATVITDYLPQKGGRMYTLAKSFKDGAPEKGTDNWLSDSKENPIVPGEESIL